MLIYLCFRKRKIGVFYEYINYNYFKKNNNDNFVYLL